MTNKEIIEKVLKELKESKLTSKRWKGKWCYWFKEELEEYPEAELLLKVVLEIALSLQKEEFEKMIKEVVKSHIGQTYPINCSAICKEIEQKIKEMGEIE
jgi:hypothetical protein